jgi:hypothetical protein
MKWLRFAKIVSACWLAWVSLSVMAWLTTGIWLLHTPATIDQSAGLMAGLGFSCILTASILGGLFEK